MFKTKSFTIFTSFILSCGLVLPSCSKNDGTSMPVTPPVTDVCAGKTITVTATKTDATPCTLNGAIEVSATGSTGFTYKVNSGGTYQSSGSFATLAAGDYSVFAKDAAGCEKSTAITIAASGKAGAKFTDVKNLIATKCQVCHSNSNANGGMNFQVECNIIANKTRIKVRAVDEGTMPQTGPLTQAEKDIISTWITAGGAYAN